MNSLIHNLAEFIDLLRSCGIQTGISEFTDAVKALGQVSLLNRSQVKYAMSSCLAKGEEERKIFSEAFDRYFILPEQRQSYIEQKTSEIQNKQNQVVEEASELRFQEDPLELPPELMEVYSALTTEEKQNLLDFLDKTSRGKNVRQEFKPIVENLVKGKLNRVKGSLQHPPEGLFDTVLSEAGILSRDVETEVNRDKELRKREISRISDEEMQQVVLIIRQMTEKLRRSLRKRYKKAAGKGRIDLKRTITASLSTGGVQFRLRYRSRRRRKDRFMILSDVSASMYRFSGFALQFLLEMNQGSPAMEGFVFSEQLEHLPTASFTNAAVFEENIKSSPVWRKGTHIARVLESILENSRTKLNSSLTVILVSDAKTLESDRVGDQLKALEKRVKQVLWLNPLPQRDWSTISGIGKMRRYCTMLDCSTLEKLAAACAEIG